MNSYIFAILFLWLQALDKAPVIQTQTIAASLEDQSSSLEEITASSQTLSASSNQLEQAVGRFKV